MSTTTSTATTATPLLSSTGETSNYSETPRFSRGTSLSNAASLLQRVNSRRMISEQSLRVRQSAAQLIEERRSELAYSTPVVIIDLVCNTILILTALIVIFVSNNEIAKVPLRSWLIGYSVQCVVHMVCVVVEFRRRREVRSASLRSFVASNSSFESNSGLNESLEDNSVSQTNSRSSLGDNSVSQANSRSNLSSSATVNASFVDVVAESRPDEDNTSVAKHLEAACTMFSFIWWIIGFYWVSSGEVTMEHSAPKLLWLTRIFLALDVLFVVLCVIVACIIGIAVCCFLPCIIAVMYTLPNESEGASNEDIGRLTKYKFRRGEAENTSGEIQELSVGRMIECDTDTPTERDLSEEHAACVICLCEYENDDELRELPCHHHFHCACIDKWLIMNPTCPLCKDNILKNRNRSTEQV